MHLTNSPAAQLRNAIPLSHLRVQIRQTGLRVENFSGVVFWLLRVTLGEQQGGVIPCPMQYTEHKNLGGIGTIEYLVVAMYPPSNAFFRVARHQRVSIRHLAKAGAFVSQFSNEGLRTGRIVPCDVVTNGDEVLPRFR